MTVKAQAGAGASLTYTEWKAIHWPTVIVQVRRLQLRIAKAFREGRHNKVKALQWILTHSFFSKLLAVKRVVQNRGAKTPGVDGIIWKTPEEKFSAALSLKRKGYQTQPLRRVYIPKKNGKLRPISMPVMACRAQQALHLLALEPVSEMAADQNAYGFRPLRSTADAIEKCFKALVQKASAHYILEGDIKNCFCEISHEWLLEKAPMDKEVLRKWLAAGYLEKGQFYPTERGTPQGGLASATLLVVTLSGLETAVRNAVPSLKDKVHVCAYADDFVITGASKEVLANKVKPAVAAFLQERGLTLSEEKTRITHIDEGFDFLGMNVRKYNGKLIIRPAKSSIKRFLTDMRAIIKKQRTIKTEDFIRLLNPKIQGWVNYHRHVCAKRAFGYVDHHLFEAIWHWARRRHPKKNAQWVKDKYYRSDQTRQWIFHSKTKDKEGKPIYHDLIKAMDTPIKRHLKIRAETTPYNPAHHEYIKQWYAKRTGMQKPKRSKGWLSWWDLLLNINFGQKDWVIEG